MTYPQHIGDIREDAEAPYLSNRAGFIKDLEHKLGTEHLTGNGSQLDYSLYFGSASDRGRRLTVMFSPLNDCAPQSSAGDLLDFIGKDSDPPTIQDRERAQPNSWRQAFKARDVHDTQVAAGYGQPVIVIYNPVPETLFNDADRIALKSGITSPYGKVAELAISVAEQKLHGNPSQGGFNNIDLYAPGLGHNAIGAAHHLRHFTKYEVASVTVPNLIANLGNKAALFARYTPLKDTYREPGQKNLPDATALQEAKISQEADVMGSERAMRRRQIKAIAAMLRSKQAGAMLKSDWIRDAIEDLLDGGVPVTVPLAYNARITENTDTILPHGHPNLERIDIKSGVEGKGVGLISNEFVTLGSILALRGMRRAFDQRTPAPPKL